MRTIHKLVPAGLLATLAGCVSFGPGVEPSGAVPVVAMAGMRNGWVPPETFTPTASAAHATTSVAAVAGGRPATPPAPQVAALKAPGEAPPDDGVVRSSSGKPASPLASENVEKVVALKGHDAGAGSHLAEKQPEGSAEESEAEPSVPEKALEEGQLVGPPAPDAAAFTAPVRRLVNSKSVTLDYEIKNVGPSGVSAVEVWCTRDGRSWQKQEVVAEGKSPIVVDVPEEGLYGFTLVARNGVGLGKRAPRAGEAPQVAVEVDVTRPAVRLTNVQIDGDATDRRIVISWRAADKNMGRRPIAISYAERAEGPWLLIADTQENSGRYVWKVPSAAPLRFLLRVEATDLAGNVGAAQTPSPVLMDQSQPEVSIRTVEPAANAGRR
jgi:hypothetical protein